MNATAEMCAHCQIAAETVRAVRAENDRMRGELLEFRRAQKRRPQFPEVEPRSGEDFVDELKDRGLSVCVRNGMGARAWMCQCPAHEDRNGSLTVTELNGGKVLLRCWAGCPTESVLDAIGWTFPMLRGRL